MWQCLAVWERIVHLDILHPQLTHFFRQRPVQLAYLFGSQATGYTHTESDVDVAVLLDAALTADERFTERLACIGALSHLFGTDNVDVVILNEAPPLLARVSLSHCRHGSWRACDIAGSHRDPARRWCLPCCICPNADPDGAVS